MDSGAGPGILAAVGQETGASGLEAWLQALRDEAVPGGVAAASAAAAMGAALVAKAARVTTSHRHGEHRERLLAVGEQARAASGELMELAEADVRAFRSALERDSAPDRDARRDEVWLAATEVPVRVAEVCRALLAYLAPLEEACWPAVWADLEVGRRLLETGVEAGLSAAEINLQQWGDRPGARVLRDRVSTVREDVT